MKRTGIKYLLAAVLYIFVLIGGTIDTQAASFVSIYTIQGSGAVSSYNGVQVITEGVVTGVFPGKSGCFIQDQNGDSNTNTSDGIWLSGVTSYSVGTKIRLTATVQESYEQTQLSQARSITVIGTGINISPTTVTLPAELEKYEGMLVAFNQMLSVTENYNLNRYGELTLSVDGRLDQPTESIDPNDNPASGVNVSGTSNVSAVTTQQSLNNQRKIILDDGSSTQNPTSNPYWDADYNCRVGSTINGLTGCVYYANGAYGVQKVQNVAINYAARPTGLSNLGAYNLKVSSFNVLNYFNGDGSGGGFPTSRGASTYNEFVRQRDKIVAAMEIIDADVYGLMELENDGSSSLSAIADLTNALNTAYGSNIYTYIADPSFIGTDEIKCGIIYKSSIVTPQGTAVSDSNTVHNRPPVAQTFVLNSNGQKFTFIVNHLKSRSATGATGADLDQGDGQGAYNATRRSQAQAIVSFAGNLASSTGVSDQIILGDWNSYGQEDPVDVMRAGGFAALLEGEHSYVYSAQSGALDHIFVTPSIASKLTGTQVLHINADEPVHLDYNTEYNPAGAYQPNAYRSSDHDPAIAAFTFSGSANNPPTASITSPTSGAQYSNGTVVSIQATASDKDGSIAQVEFFANDISIGVDTTSPYSINWTIGTGSFSLIARAIDNLGAAGTSDAVNVTGISNSQGSLIISEYVEGSSYNKAIEIANVGGAPIDLANYNLRKQTNGSGSWGSPMTLSGTLQPGEVYVIAHSSASSTLKALANLTTSDTTMTFNGNDPVGLFENSTLQDIVGTFNGGSGNFAIDTTLRRNAAVNTPNTNYQSSEWTSHPKDTFSGLGSR